MEVIGRNIIRFVVGDVDVEEVVDNPSYVYKEGDIIYTYDFNVEADQEIVHKKYKVVDVRHELRLNIVGEQVIVVYLEEVK